MKEISGIATEEESFFKDRQTWNRCHVCNSKKERNMKTLEKTLTLSFIFFLWMKEHCCQRISVQYNQFIAQTLLTQTDVAPNLESFCTHSTCLLWLVHSSKLSFHGPFEKDFPPLFFFFSTQRLDQLQPYSESLSQPKQTVVCSTSFTLLWRRGLWAATSHSLHASSASGLNYFDKGTSKGVDGYVWNCMCVLEYLSSSFSTGSLPWHCDHIQTNYASLAFKM